MSSYGQNPLFMTITSLFIIIAVDKTKEVITAQPNVENFIENEHRTYQIYVSHFVVVVASCKKVDVCVCFAGIGLFTQHENLKL